LISSAVDQAGISCVLIGGFAINHYKVSRQTADVDFLITREDFEKISGLLKKAGYKEDFSQKVFTRLRSANQAILMDVDFMFVDKETLAGILKEGQKVRLAGQEFIVPSLNHLIALKLHSLKYNFKARETKDLPDIIDLVRTNKINFKSKAFKELCLKYGTEELFHKVLEKA
jgi:hypothetical protein